MYTQIEKTYRSRSKSSSGNNWKMLRAAHRQTHWSGWNHPKQIDTRDLLIYGVVTCPGHMSPPLTPKHFTRISDGSVLICQHLLLMYSAGMSEKSPSFHPKSFCRSTLFALYNLFFIPFFPSSPFFIGKKNDLSVNRLVGIIDLSPFKMCQNHKLLSLKPALEKLQTASLCSCLAALPQFVNLRRTTVWRLPNENLIYC